MLVGGLVLGGEINPWNSSSDVHKLNCRFNHYGNSSKLEVGSARNEVICAALSRNNDTTAEVGPFPIRSQITFGGWPFVWTISRKSESFDTRANP